MFKAKQKAEAEAAAAVQAQAEGRKIEEPDVDPMQKWRYLTIALLSVGFLLFQLYMALVRPIDLYISSPVHLGLAIILVFLYKPLAETYKKKWMWAIDFTCIALSVSVMLYYILNNEYLTYRIMMVDPMRGVDMYAGIVLLLLLLFATYRTLGLNLTIFIGLFILYAFAGQYITGPFRYSGTSLPQFIEMLALSSDGIFGSPLSTSVNTLFYFLLFGAFLSNSGGGDVLLDLGMKLSTKSHGGPAKAAVVSSGLLGMISGSAVANVTTTGVVTIPLMKKAGYTPEEAGAVEAVASTGGQIMPPIMGVGAFIMAEMIGVSYAKIAQAALIPALAYYAAVFILVDFIARRKNLKEISTELLKNEVVRPVAKRLYLLIPILSVVILVLMGRSLTSAALMGIVLCVAIAAISKETRMSPKKLLDTALNGIKQAANIAIPTAACGIMIGIVVRSGAANKLTKIISAVGGSSVAVALIIAMIGCLVLGMALPTVAAYLIANILFCPTIVALGIPALPANMFIFYFGVVAQITPPVCLASFTAAGIAGANSWKCGWTAFRYVLVAFLTPYCFVFQPAILMQGTFTEIAYACFVMGVGVLMLGAAMGGWMLHSLNMPMRLLFFVAAICVIIPETITDIIGIVAGIILISICYLQARKQKATPAAVA